MSFLIKFHKKEKPLNTPKNWKEALFRDFDIIYIFVIFMLLYILLFRVVVVEGDSMNQTLVDGDVLLLASSTVYHNPKQGDIIVVSKDSFRDGECFVKRVIATEGQTVRIDFRNRIVYVDEKPLDESYVYFQENDHRPMNQGNFTEPVTVGKDCVFVMGDNRNNSQDSRHSSIGLVEKREILGRVIFLLIPGTDEGHLPADYSRIGGLN